MKVEALFTAAEGRAAIVSRDAVTLLVGLGIEGDRYATDRGTFSHWPGPGRQVSLISREDLEALERHHGIVLPPGGHRRNIQTVGVDLKTLIGRNFRIGDEVVLEGIRRCAPCGYIERMNRTPGLKDALNALGGGIRADVVIGGVIRVGDRVTILE